MKASLPFLHDVARQRPAANKQQFVFARSLTKATVMTIKKGTPDARIDRFVVAWTGRVRGAGHLIQQEVEALLRPVGRISTPKSKRRAGYVQVTLDLSTEEHHSAGAMRVELHMRSEDGDLVFGDRCAISGNGMVMLRGILGPEQSGPLSYDGKANVLGPQHYGPDLTRLQLRTLREAFEFVLDALRAAFGAGWEPNQLWLRVAEACRDSTTRNAILDTRIVQHATLCGTVERRWDEYERIGGLESQGVPTLRLITRVIGPEEKVYGKRHDTRRQELVCPDRHSVVELTGVRRGKFCSLGALRLFLHFLTVACPRLDRLDAHVRSALESETSITALLIALKPLIDRACGDRKTKGPVSPEAQDVANSIVEALLSVGMFDARGIDSNHAIRRELDAMRGPEGPLDKHDLRAIYYLKPRFARACAVMRSSVVN